MDASAEPCPWVALEHGGLSLDVYLRKGELFKGEAMRLLVGQLATALKLLHGLHICHLDVKPPNLLWNFAVSSMKLADCGMLEFTSARETKPPAYILYVTEGYRPPELYVGDVSRALLRPAVDIFSAGSALYEACVGKMLLRPIGAKGSLRESLQHWCAMCRSGPVGRTVSLAGWRSKNAQPEQILACRLHEAAEWRDLVLKACAPKPADRTLP